MAKGGKSSRTRSKARRDGEKRARKAQKKALYQGYARSGENSKGSRTQRKMKARAHLRFNLVSHPNGPCGNIGCVKCFGLVGSKEWIKAKSFKGIYT